TIALDLEAAAQNARAARVGKSALVGLDRPALIAALGEVGIEAREAKMRVSQLWNWIYSRGVTDFERMTNIGKETRQLLADHFEIGRPEIVTEQVSSDGTRKWLFRYRDPANPAMPPVDVETVYIPEPGRGTLCVSSQVGCTLTCTFCHTGTQRLVRNLTAGEILSQVLMARERLGDYPGGKRPDDGGLVPSGETRAITNV
ncbi:unnamed protein product, partial [Laminaria digitata]